MATTSSTSSVSGIISGLDTSSIISQLMQVEAQPQTDLKSKVMTEQTVIAAYQSVNAKMQSLQSAADTFSSITTWQAATATSSNTAVAATASPGAASGDYTFNVTQLAKAQVSNITLPGSGSMTADGNLYISTNGGSPVTVPVTTDTPDGVAAAINGNASLGLKASVINTDQGKVLQVVSKNTGVANGFTITGGTGGAQVDRVSPQDAVLTVGDPNNGGYTVTNSSNTFTSFIPNVTMTVTAQQDNVTVSVNSDASGIGDKIQAMVDAANAALSEIANQTAYTPANASTGAAAQSGALLGNSTVQQLQQNILSAISSGFGGYGSFSKLGLQLSQDGSITFDKSTFVSAYQADPSGVQNAVQNGVGKTISTLGKRATDITSGTLTTAIQGGTDQIRQLNAQIDDWTVRLADRQQTLQAQFTAMEVSLGKLKDQSSWLSGQIASLPSGSSG